MSENGSASSRELVLAELRDGDRFVLATGGEVRNTGAKLREFLTRPPSGIELPKN